MLDAKLGRFDMTELQPFFDNLPEDKYTEGGYRFRRLSEIKVEWIRPDTFEMINCPGRIMQPTGVNGFLPDVDREYEAIEDGLFNHPRFRNMVEKFQELTGWYNDFNIHQIRIIGKPGESTYPAPEGPHTDGYTWTVPFVLGCTNVKGGEFSIFDKDMKKKLWVDASHNYAMFPDDKVYHYAEPIRLIDEDKPGYWDVFVFTAGDCVAPE